MRTRVWFDGNELTERCVVSDLQRPLLPRDIQMVSVPGRDGGLLAGVTLADRTLTLTLTFRGKPDKRAEAMRKVAAMLNVAEKKPLVISEDNGLSYMAIPNAAEDGTRSVNAESFVVTFLCDPLMISPDKKRFDFTWTGSGEFTFAVEGTAPCPCVLAIQYATSSASTVTVDTGETIILGGTTTTSSMQMASRIDSENRTMVTVLASPWPPNFDSGYLDVLPYTSDWIVLEPGIRTLSLESDVPYERHGYIEFSPRWV